MSDVIERVARAMWANELPDDMLGEFAFATSRGLWLARARAAIEVMREPTEEMRDAGDEEMGDEPWPYTSHRIWTRMIDAALPPQEVEG